MKKKIKGSLICIYIILLCCLCLTTAFSRNITKTSGTGSIEFADMILNIDKKVSKLTNVSNVWQDIPFTITNYEGTVEAPTLNDTQFKYKIVISNNKNIPLEYELYRIDNDNETKVTITDGQSEDFVMEHSKIQEDKFILKVKLNDKTYKDMEDIISIEAYAVQE